MLDVAINHKDELNNKFTSIWFQEKYKFYNNDTWFENPEIDINTWNHHQYVSINSAGEIIGYISYAINRQTNSAHELGIINFSDDRITFGTDLKIAITDIFDKFKFQKLSFSVVVGNPIESSYDKMVTKYGGRIVGIAHNEAKLYDNEYYSVKYYEILREDYIRKHSH